MFMRMNLLLLAFCCLLAAAPGRAAERIVIAGTGDSQALLRDLALAYEQSHPESRIEVPESVGSSGGIRLTAAGQADLGRVARPLGESEKRFDLQYRQFGLSPVVFAVHPGLKGVENLTDRQAVAIYAGTITNWRELGGDDDPVLAASREPGDSSRTVLEQQLPGFRALPERPGRTIYSTPETVATIGRHENTIGYLPLSAARDAGLKILALNNIPPSEENVRQGLYPLAVPLGLVWKDEPTGLAADFLSYLTSREAGDILRTHGVVPVDRR